MPETLLWRRLGPWRLTQCGEPPALPGTHRTRLSETQGHSETQGQVFHLAFDERKA